jgi:predicted negative regulator of RcsB-dependent stress response
MGAPLPAGTTPAAQRDWGEYFRTHSRELAYGATAVVVIGVAIWLYVTSEMRKQAFAAQALSQARAEVDAGNLPLAANDLTRLVDRYGGTRAADDAVVLLDDVRLLMGRTEVAVQDLRKLVAGSHSKDILASGWSLLGSGLESERKFKDAAAAYRKVAEVATHDFFRAQGLLDAGRVLTVAGDTAGARAAYGELLEKYGELSQAAEARVRMGEVGGTVPAAKPKSGAAKQG